MSRETEAADWFARMCGRDAEKHRAAFDAWMTDPDNAAIYAEANKRWANLDDGSPARILAKTPQPSKPFPLRWATAFVVALALTFGFAWYLGQARSGPQIAASSTAPGNMRLADGTSVELMDGAKVKARFSETERRIVMTGGRARFTVAHDASRPFRVAAGGSEVIALGTVFEVDLTRANPVIRLVSGSVEIRAPGSGGQAIRLHPGESAEVRDRQPRRITLSDPKPEVPAQPMAPSAAAVPPARLVVADKLPLGEVIDRANRVNSRPIRLADPALGSLEITGRFDVSDSASLARKLSAAFELNVEQDADGIILTRG